MGASSGSASDPSASPQGTPPAWPGTSASTSAAGPNSGLGAAGQTAVGQLAAQLAAHSPTASSQSLAPSPTPAAQSLPTMKGIGPGLSQLLGQPMTPNYQQAMAPTASPAAVGPVQATPSPTSTAAFQGYQPQQSSALSSLFANLAAQQQPSNSLSSLFQTLAAQQPQTRAQASFDPNAMYAGGFGQWTPPSGPGGQGFITGPQPLPSNFQTMATAQSALPPPPAAQQALPSQIAQNIAITGYAQPFFGSAPAAPPTVAGNAASNPVGIPPTVPLPSTAPNTGAATAPENDSFNGASYDGGNPGNWSSGAGG